MSAKSKCLAIDSSLYCKKFGAGKFMFFQIFKGDYFYSGVAKTEKEAWVLAEAKLKQEPTND